MTDGNDPAYPTIGIQNNEESGLVGSLSKREYFAAMAMQGIMFWDATVNDKEYTGRVEELAKQSVCVADALIAALNKKGPNE